MTHHIVLVILPVMHNTQERAERTDYMRMNNIRARDYDPHTDTAKWRSGRWLRQYMEWFRSIQELGKTKLHNYEREMRVYEKQALELEESETDVCLSDRYEINRLKNRATWMADIIKKARKLEVRAIELCDDKTNEAGWRHDFERTVMKRLRMGTNWY